MAPTPATPSSMRLDQRENNLRLARETEWDVVVIGGGVTGCGTALDAASRGLRTLLIERVDFAAGTSRWSSKLCHGGLRYLAKGQIDVAWESARERHWILTKIAPHLAKAEAFYVPLNKQMGRIMGTLTMLGVLASDVLRRIAGTPSSALPSPSLLNRTATHRALPSITTDGLRGAIKYWDGQLSDDARYVTALARTAVAHGATVLNYAGAENITRTGSGYEVTVRDEITSATFAVRSKEVISANGVWVHELAPELEVLPSRGTHIVVESKRVGDPTGVVVTPVPGSLGRFIFILPQQNGLCYVGLTDELAPEADGIAPAVPTADEDFLLSCINPLLAQPLTREDIIGRYAGLRPLVRDAGAKQVTSSADVSRKHLLVDVPGKPLVLVGGKFTTYRQMAQDAVDAVCHRLGSQKRCRTRSIPLVGAAPRRILRQIQAPARLVSLYGTAAEDVMRLAEKYPEFAGPVAPGLSVTGAEMLYAILHEGAVCVGDVIERRTRCTMREDAINAAREKAQQAFAVLGLKPLLEG